MREMEKQPPWLTYLEWDVLGKPNASDARVYEVVVKIRPEGLLAVIKARKADQYTVTFVGGRSLASLSGLIRKRVVGEPEKWREDKYVQI